MVNKWILNYFSLELSLNVCLISVSKSGLNKTNWSGHVRNFNVTQYRYRMWNQPVFNVSDGSIRFILGELKPKHWKPFSHSASVSRVLTQLWRQSVVQALQNVWTCQHMVIAYRRHATGAVNTHGNRHLFYIINSHLIRDMRPSDISYYFFLMLCHAFGLIFAILGGI